MMMPALSQWLVFACLLVTTCAVKKHDFKSGFCRRNRARADRAAASKVFTSPYSITNPHFTNGVFSARLHNALADQARFSFEIRFQKDGVARIVVDEVDGLYQRYNESAKWSLVDTAPIEPHADNKAYAAEIGDKSSRIEWNSGHNDVIIDHAPLKLVFQRDGQPHIVMNDRALFNMEHYRKKEGAADPNPPDMQVQDSDTLNVPSEAKGEDARYPGFADTEEEGLWEETFGGKLDTKKRGPESLSLDISFPGYEHVFGIPNHSGPLSLRTTRGGSSNFTDPYRLYNLDVFEYEADSPMALYGAIPMMHAARAGSTVAVFWLNGAETWIDIEKGSTPKPVTDAWRKTRRASGDSTDQGPTSRTTQTHWISEAGVLDLFVFLGPSTEVIHKQYTDLTGKTAMPQLFAIAHHQCRWNYLTQEDVLEVSANFDKHDIPMDVIWLDIEYAEEHKYFVWDRKNFPEPEKMQQGLAARGRQLVAIIDPHIKRTDDLYVYKEAKDLDILYKNADGSEFDGWCWTGSSAWVDFFNPKSWSWWIGLYKFDKFKGSTRNLFIWNDMNEPSIFNGPEITAPKDNLHHGGWEHRDLHNINGMVYHELNAKALIERESPARRPFVLTRSFFAGSQRISAAWHGDNMGTWEHFANSVQMILANGVGGFAFTGADAGGFFGNPTLELLVRWYQAAAFAPFFRAHAHIDTKRREPYLFDDPWRSHLRDALRLRYSLLPVFYTAFWDSHRAGQPIAKPQYMVFPEDAAGFAVDDQYFVGESGLLIHPVVQEGATSVSVYLAGSQPYYNYFTNELFAPNGATTLPVEIDTIPLFIRGGHIFPRRDLVRRSAILTWLDPITLVVAVDATGSKAIGSLYLDDGDSYAFEKGEFIWRQFELGGAGQNLILRSTDLASAKQTDQKALSVYSAKNAWAQKIAQVPISGLVVRGLPSKPTCVRVKGSSTGLEYSWKDGLASTAAKKRGGVGQIASELVIDHAGVKVVEDWIIEILFDTECSTSSPPLDPVVAGQADCEPGKFKCANKGHIPYCLLASRVNDGICDPECCDGSDEFDGKVQCADVCGKVGAEHKKQLEEESRKNRVGAKIKAEYISFGEKEKKQIEANIGRFEVEIHGAEDAEKRLKGVLEATEARQSEDIDRKKATGLYKRLEEYQSAIKSLRAKRTSLEQEMDELKTMLTELREGWNPNSQDMTVKGIVRGYEAWAQKRGLLPKDDGETVAEIESEAGPNDDHLDTLQDADPLELMDDIDEHRLGRPAADSSLFRIEDYVPASFKPHYQTAVSSLLGLLNTIGVLRGQPAADVGERADVTRARNAHSAAVSSLADARKQLDEAKASLEQDWGPQWEWKKLDGLCLEKEVGDYTYELCMFKEGKQKSTKSHSSTTLGRFAGWDGDEEDRYASQLYDGGQQCWNGPERSIILDITCGTSNQLLSVTEPEKCTYLFTATSPARCGALPADQAPPVPSGRFEL